MTSCPKPRPCWTSAPRPVAGCSRASSVPPPAAGGCVSRPPSEAAVTAGGTQVHAYEQHNRRH
jgi:hypothetical protein